MVCVYDEPDGRGNLRVAKTPPLQSALAGMLLLVALGVVDKINVFAAVSQCRGAARHVATKTGATMRSIAKGD